MSETWWAIGLAVLAHAAAAIAQETSADKKLYCWERAGSKVCSDALPPEQAAAARRELSARSGRTLEEIARPMTAEERRAAAEAARLEQAQADIRRAAARRDLAMVESYASEAELRRAFGDRIVLVDESIKGSLLAEENLRRGLVSLLNRACDLELIDKPVPNTLQQAIRKQHGDLTRLLATLRDQRRESDVLNDELENALQRYRDLRAQREAGGTH